MSAEQSTPFMPDTGTAGNARVTFHTCDRCWSTNHRIEMRDAHFPAPRNAYGMWFVCECGHEWPAPRRSIFDA